MNKRVSPTEIASAIGTDADETLTARQLFDCLWSWINGDDSWAANPWVWVIEFRVTSA